MAPDIVAIGASSGGLEPLKALICDLPDDLTVTMFITVHIGPHRSVLPEVLNYCRSLPSSHPQNGEPIAPGHIYVAPSDRHLMIEAGHIKLSRGPRENLTRPAIDPMFRAVAHEYRARAIGIVLSGGLGDGTAGLAEIKRCGGTAIVQDPKDAQDSSMPASALRHVAIDHCLPATGIAALLPQLLARAAPRGPLPIPMMDPGKDETMSSEYSLKPPELLVCPDCGGALKETSIGAMPYYNCHIGHSFSAADMDAGQFQQMERTLEVGFRTMVERIALCRRLGKMARETGLASEAEQWLAAETEVRERAQVLREFLDQSWIRPSSEFDSPA